MFLRELVSMHSRRRFMDEIQNPTSLINKDYEEIELVTLDDWLDNFDELSK